MQKKHDMYMRYLTSVAANDTKLNAVVKYKTLEYLPIPKRPGTLCTRFSQFIEQICF